MRPPTATGSTSPPARARRATFRSSARAIPGSQWITTPNSYPRSAPRPRIRSFRRGRLASAMPRSTTQRTSRCGLSTSSTPITVQCASVFRDSTASSTTSLASSSTNASKSWAARQSSSRAETSPTRSPKTAPMATRPKARIRRANHGCHGNGRLHALPHVRGQLPG